jgi:hypothetical protein
MNFETSKGFHKTGLVLFIVFLLVPHSILSQVSQRTSSSTTVSNCFNSFKQLTFYSDSIKNATISKKVKSEGGNTAVVTQLGAGGTVEIKQSGTKNVAVVATPENTKSKIDQEGCRNIVKLIAINNSVLDWKNFFLHF